MLLSYQAVRERLFKDSSPEPASVGDGRALFLIDRSTDIVGQRGAIRKN